MHVTAPLFRVDDLHVQLADHTSGPILDGLDLTVNAGEIHAIMGANGSGTSALGSVLMGSNEYDVHSGTIEFRGDDITDWPTDERAKVGLFLAFRQPQEIPGVTVIQFLRQALSARNGVNVSVLELRLAALDWTKRLGIDSSFIDRRLDEGLSEAEQRSSEILQMAFLEPEIALLDATDSDLDTDAVNIVFQGIREVRAEQHDMGVVLITQHQHLIDAVRPDHVHVLVDGRIVASGGRELATRFVHDGNDAFAMADATRI